jgi:hypothetical protein
MNKPTSICLMNACLPGILLALASCASQKQEALPAPTAAVKEEVKPQEPAVEPEVGLPMVDQGFRMPEMLSLPNEGEFRATNPVLPKPATAGAVISRPPTDPPSRVKPTETPAAE